MNCSRRKIEVTAELLREFLAYEPETGKLFWRARNASHFPDGEKRSASHLCAAWNARMSGKEAFTALDDGYCVGSIANQKLRAHRVAWAIASGAMPPEKFLVDHINGVRSDNRLANLRLVTFEQNVKNNKKFRETGIPCGVKRRGKNRWEASVQKNGVLRNLGRFSTPEDAAAARLKFEQESYTDPHGTVFIDRESHAGAWAKFLRDTNHGE